ncbi:hypothetical protein TREMEDRAFT_31511 [Tremella mesenterica DSM 1558]|uniref:uncharacterized protein n=1 Tax=Tremella mesenterica (strain ATCC 24925 / CBS 8224 / DSM 1558 / NBRC 9311 / NRRL Y-6157 / RJB 2259-6 / UBC 559-6) TaxID=578456 RepID=UPI0003F49DBF|nr:uncharacterized protein TREMEDRAFT_31511 [Tremella mesenterica DSM 1558]EIW68906.1 hypothetical protein TREMEDRAFT_31511 [Tremella mesenterica DSM 1558]
MPFSSGSTTRAFRARSIPLLTASTISFAVYTYHSQVIRNDAETPLSYPTRKPLSPTIPISPYTPLGWGSNRYMTLVPDSAVTILKKPSPLPHLGATPLRDLIIAEKYGACVDARGDCWMWGVGYDPSGQLGRSLQGKLYCLSTNGNLYVVSSSRSFQAHRLDRTDRSWYSRFWPFGTDPGVDYVQLKPQGGLRRGERWENLSAGTHHLLAVTNKGRTFSLPISPAGNSHRQLGTRQIIHTPFPVPASLSTSETPPDLPPEADPRFATTLTEIPSLTGVNIAQVVASDRTSFVRTTGGRVLGFGANELGQVGLGSNAIVDTVQTPVEIVLARNYPGGTQVKCLDVYAGGQTTFFVVESTKPEKAPLIDLLACGNGISGALGNGLWSSAVGQPVRVKTVSGLQEFSEKANAFLPLAIHSISVSSSPWAHAVAVLDTVSQADEKGVKAGRYGKDVMVWGGNSDYQLGNGKRSSLAIPQHLPPLISSSAEREDLLSTPESELNSGSLTHMPHFRLQLHQSKADAYDLEGKLIKRKVKCEETVVAGYNASVLYNKIID